MTYISRAYFFGAYFFEWVDWNTNKNQEEMKLLDVMKHSIICFKTFMEAKKSLAAEPSMIIPYKHNSE